MQSCVEVRSLACVQGKRTTLQDIDLVLAPGQIHGVLGPRWAGKTTLLRLLNGLATPTSGTVSIDGTPMSGDLAVRRRRIGTMLQAPALFPHRTIYDNVATVPRLLGWEEARIRTAARDLLEQLELPFDRFATRFPRSLSGGEQQRVGIARAIVTDPTLLLCDEPTGDLDRKTGDEILGLLQALNTEHGKTIIMVTHDPHASARAGRTVYLDKGQLSATKPE